LHAFDWTISLASVKVICTAMVVYVLIWYCNKIIGYRGAFAFVRISVIVAQKYCNVLRAECEHVTFDIF